jgi:thymidine kinase
MMLRAGKTVWVCGLNGNWAQRRLGCMLDLIPFADDMQFMRALCMDCADGTLASFTCRRDMGANLKCDVDIGAYDKYIPVCRRHLLARQEQFDVTHI